MQHLLYLRVRYAKLRTTEVAAGIPAPTLVTWPSECSREFVEKRAVLPDWRRELVSKAVSANGEIEHDRDEYVDGCRPETPRLESPLDHSGHGFFVETPGIQ